MRKEMVAFALAAITAAAFDAASANPHASLAERATPPGAPEISWSVMHPTAIDTNYMARVAAKAVEYGGVDSFEICGDCHSGMGGMDGLLLFEPHPAAAEVPESIGEYPDPYMFGYAALPAWGFYLRHAPGVTFDNVRLRLRPGATDARVKVVNMK